MPQSIFDEYERAARTVIGKYQTKYAEAMRIEHANQGEKHGPPAHLIDERIRAANKLRTAQEVLLAIKEIAAEWDQDVGPANTK